MNFLEKVNVNLRCSVDFLKNSWILVEIYSLVPHKQEFIISVELENSRNEISGELEIGLNFYQFAFMQKLNKTPENNVHT